MVDGNPRPRIAAPGGEVEDALRPAQRLVERRLAGVVLTSGEHAVLDGAGDDRVPHSRPPKTGDVAVRVRLVLLRQRQPQLQYPMTGELWQRRVRRQPRSWRQVRLDPAMGDDARVRLRQRPGVADRPG